MRKLSITIGAVVLALAGLATPARAATTTITAGLSSSSVRVGATVYVQGKVSPANATSRVVVQRAVDHAWSDRTAGNVNASTGSYKIAIKPSQSGTYKLRVRSNGGSVASSTIYLKVTAPPTTISAHLSTSSVRSGATTYVVGRVSVADATSRVVVQRSTGGGWSDVASSPVDQRKGEFSVPTRITAVGRHTLRVRTNGGSVVSGSFTLTVTAASTPPPPGPRCDPNYSGCVPIASDVDCAGGSGNGPAYVQGPVYIIGSDIYDLDGNDHDGIGCES